MSGWYQPQADRRSGFSVTGKGGLYAFQRGMLSVIVVTHYRGRRGTLEEVITYNLGCSCVVVNNADANYFKRVGICSKLA